MPPEMKVFQWLRRFCKPYSKRCPLPRTPPETSIPINWFDDKKFIIKLRPKQVFEIYSWSMTILQPIRFQLLNVWMFYWLAWCLTIRTLQICPLTNVYCSRSWKKSLSGRTYGLQSCMLSVPLISYKKGGQKLDNCLEFCEEVEPLKGIVYR